ncbi:MAG TPA: hypothetical protein VMX33_11085 [bacterium]|nr:hypothetical protein [bacterium]
MQRVLNCRILPALALSICLGAFISCVSTQPVQVQPVETDATAVEAAPEPDANPAADQFDPSSVSVELKQTTFIDIRALINSLNSIIQAKDYDAWSQALTDAYRDHYSSAETLAQISDSPVLKRQGIVLNTLKDYFLYVVYPSRQHDRVDDIEFMQATRIRAITVTAKGERLVLYNLEKIGDTWKIAIWR